MKKTDKYKASITENFYKEIKRIVSIFYYQTIYNIKDKMLLPLNLQDTVPEDSIYKQCFTEYSDYEDLYGHFFDDYEEFCNGDLDMKTYTKKKDLESDNIIKKSISTYYSYLKFEQNKIKYGLKKDNKGNIIIDKNYTYESILEKNDKDKKEPQKMLTIPSMLKVNKDMKEMPEITNLAYFQPEKDDLHEVDFLVKMVENEKDNSRVNSRKASYDIYDDRNLNDNKSTNEKDTSSKKDLYSLLNNQKIENENNSISKLNTNKTPEKDKFNPFKMNESSIQNQKSALNSIKTLSPLTKSNTKSPIKESPNIIALLGTKRKAPEPKTLDFSNVVTGTNKSPNKINQVPNLYSPNPNLNIKYNMFDTSKVKNDLTSSFKTMKKE